MMQIEEVCVLLGRLTVVSHQILDDVEEVSKTGDHALFYERMVANAEDLQTALTTSPQQVAQTTRQGERHD
jgi:hypothetical protein